MFLQTLVTGLSIGGIYALMAVGYSLVFSVLGFSNFAHGAVIMLGAYLGLALAMKLHLGIGLVLVGSIVGSGILAVMNERLAYSVLRRRKAPSLYLMISAMGCSVFLENLVYATIGSRFYAFPEFFSRMMPGWMINIALIVHSDEALLAAGFIFTIHFFNKHFRLEKFPMDTVIFSGRISKAEMLHERKRWYDRLVAEGRLDDFRVKDEWERWKSIARTFGHIFFGLGVVLLILIIYAMTTRLVH